VPTPWYEVVEGSSLETGDIILQCTIHSPVFPANPLEDVSELSTEIFDVIVLSQSCDLVERREKLSHVVLCPLILRSQIEADKSHSLHSKGALSQAAKNKEPAFFVLQSSDHPECLRELSVVTFRQVYSYPVEFLRKVIVGKGKRLRLRSPYKEALSSRFASFFGRVALPDDVIL
jgi:hypothetical protein